MTEPWTEDARQAASDAGLARLKATDIEWPRQGGSCPVHGATCPEFPPSKSD